MMEPSLQRRGTLKHGAHCVKRGRASPRGRGSHRALLKGPMGVLLGYVGISIKNYLPHHSIS
jgi:hypothetical protein